MAGVDDRADSEHAGQRRRGGQDLMDPQVDRLRAGEGGV